MLLMYTTPTLNLNTVHIMGNCNLITKCIEMFFCFVFLFVHNTIYIYIKVVTYERHV